MKTITTLEILNLAHSQLMQRLEKEEIFAKNFKREHKKESEISVARISKYKNQMNELHSEICKLEKEEN